MFSVSAISAPRSETALLSAHARISCSLGSREIFNIWATPALVRSAEGIYCSEGPSRKVGDYFRWVELRYWNRRMMDYSTTFGILSEGSSGLH
jgi:hypothetical protein